MRLAVGGSSDLFAILAYRRMRHRIYNHVSTQFGDGSVRK
jgi:hypothetical protein